MKKIDILKSNGTYNKQHKLVKKAEFLEDEFYDPMDMVQVKYEMLREAQDSDKSIVEVVNDYGFSRTSYYVIREKYEQNGMSGLLPEKTGPKRPHKLTDALQEFIDEYITNYPDASASKITSAIQKEKDVKISKRTIERYISKKKRTLI